MLILQQLRCLRDFEVIIFLQNFQQQKKQKPQKRYVVCYSKDIRKESRYQCGNCEQKPRCFMLYHTAIKYSQK